MKWLKKWSYLILLVGMGILYLACVDKWQVYAKSLQTAKNWYESLGQSGALLADGTVGGAGTRIPAAWTRGRKETGLPDGAGGMEETGSADGSGEEEGQEGSSAEPSGPDSGAGDGTDDPDGAKGEGAEETPEGSVQLPEDEGAGGDDAFYPPEPKEVTYMTVEDDYFSDAVFIGDSRTMGLFEYAGLEETAAFYASTGLTVYKMFDSEIVPGENGKMTVEEALQQNAFSKIYLMIGINEMGTGTVESFLEAYQEAVNHLRELQPDAIIYLQAIIKVTTERSQEGDYITNEGIIARNEGIAQMADNEHIFYLDVNPLICDDTGGMIPEYTFDGVHLKAVYIDIWKEFLKTHAVSLP